MKYKFLTPKRQAFVAHFVAQGFIDATAAATKAGYSPNANNNTMRRLAYDLVHDPSIRQAIDQALKEKLQAAGLTPYDVLKTMLAIATFDPAQVVQWDAHGNLTLKASDDLDPFTRRAITRMKQRSTTDVDGNIHSTLEFWFESKVPVLTTLMEHLGLKQTVVPDGSPEGVTIIINNRIANVPIGPDNAA